ncbi:hypothetical protein BOX15_Mlig021700g1, partial [Macrostomum lignano]
EFPELGQHCADQSCKQLDFLPLRCDLCQNVYCKLHFAYASHSCPLAYKKENQVPACPLCSRPIPVAPGEDANAVVGRHMDTDCNSEPAQRHRKRAGRCSAAGCRTRELVPVTCPSCRLNFCIKHRLEQDHACAGFQSSGRAVSNAAAVARQQQHTQQQQQRRQSPPAAAPQAPNLLEAQRGLSDQEALQMALRMSAAEAPVGATAAASAAEQRRRQEELDRQLAESLQASERQQQRGQQQQQRNQQHSGSDGNGCAMS